MGGPHTLSVYRHWLRGVNRCVGGGLIVPAPRPRVPGDAGRAIARHCPAPRHNAAICAVPPPVLYCTVLYCTAPPPAQHSFVRDILLLCGQLWRIIQLDQISTGKISARRPQHLHNGGRRRVGGLTPVTTNLTFNQNIISWLPMFIFIENICTRPRVEYLPGCSLTV